MESETTLPAELQVDGNVANEAENAPQRHSKDIEIQAKTNIIAEDEVTSAVTKEARDKIIPAEIVTLLKPDWPELSQKERCANDLRKYRLYNENEVVTVDACSALHAISESKIRPLKIVIPCFARQVLVSPNQLSASS